MTQLQVRRMTPRGRSCPDTHPVDELVWVSEGRVLVTVGDESLTATPRRAVYVPAGIDHWFELLGRAAIVPLFLPSARHLGDRPLSIPRTAELNRVAAPLANVGRAPTLATEAFLTALRPWTRTPRPPLPSDPRALQIAQRILADPSDNVTLATLAAQVGVSVRTLQRTFLAETGMSFTRWRTRCRLRAGADLLRDGGSVADAARAAGYTASTFIARYREAFGTTPGREARELRAL